MEVSLAAGDLEAVFVPTVGMVGRSLRHRGEEVLGQRGGVAAYAERGATFGLPLLHPWANRLDAHLDTDRSPVRLDANGLPIHGLLTAARGWEVVEQSDRRLEAHFDFSAERLLAAFPYPHRLTAAITLDQGGLEVATTVEPTGDHAVPIAFGWHPYLTLPETARDEWQIEVPVRVHARLDERGIPTGQVDDIAPMSGALGARTFDDLFLELPQPATFAVWDSRRRIEVVFAEGYPVAQVYAPDGDDRHAAGRAGASPDKPSTRSRPSRLLAAGDFICFEPMTAPTNALVSGHGLRRVAPDESFTARFRLAVSNLGGGAGR